MEKRDFGLELDEDFVRRIQYAFDKDSNSNFVVNPSEMQRFKLVYNVTCELFKPMGYLVDYDLFSVLKTHGSITVVSDNIKITDDAMPVFVDLLSKCDYIEVLALTSGKTKLIFGFTHLTKRIVGG